MGFALIAREEKGLEAGRESHRKVAIEVVVVMRVTADKRTFLWISLFMLFSLYLVARRALRYPAVPIGSSTVQAMSSSSSAPVSSRPLHRILAYGDSLTAGTCDWDFFPYAPYLEAALIARGQNAVVRHRGLPGWTAFNMLKQIDGERSGLRSAIQAIKDPPLSIVIILAGTNDLGHGFDAGEISENLVGLHGVCFENGVKRTVAVAIPPSGYQSNDEEAASLAASVNSKLKEFCLKEKRSTFVPFPFPFVEGGENWNHDTLHFSEAGYKVLGESLAPIIDQILNNLDGD